MQSSPVSKFAKQFPFPHTVIPLVRIDDADEAIMACIDKIKGEGAHGVILINRDISVTYQRIIKVHQMVRARHPKLWIGMNFVDLNSLAAMKKLPHGAPGVWIPDTGINTANKIWPTTWAEAVRDVFSKRGGNSGTIVFGGLVSERTGRNDFIAAAQLATRFVDVIVLGSEMDPPPSLRTIGRIREAIGNFPLAVAGIMGPSLMERLMPHVDCIMPCAHPKQHSHSQYEMHGFMVNVLLQESRRAKLQHCR